VKDLFYFGENYHLGEDSFKYTFGCVKKETNLFYTQEADGILGMARGGQTGLYSPIYEVLYE
jgi:hypothetical protein